MSDLFATEQTVMMLIRRTIRQEGEPEGWRDMMQNRLPPMPYWQRSNAMPGICPVCLQTCFARGSHNAADGLPKANQRWHTECVKLYHLWTNPGQFGHWIARRQNGVCAASGVELTWRTGDEVDHLEPIWRVRRDRDKYRWPDVLRFYGPRNLQVLSRSAHLAKTALEAGQRAAGQDSDGSPGVSREAG